MLNGTLHWGKKMLTGSRAYGGSAMKIEEYDVPMTYKGVYKSLAKDFIKEIFYKKVTADRTFLVRDVDFDKQLVKVIMYVF